jgi:UDP-glucose 4-epimerase
MQKLTGKTVLITGGTGSFGRAMVDRLLQMDVKEIRIFSRYELKQELIKILKLNCARYNSVVSGMG